MKRLNKENINTPEFFNKKFNGTFGLHDIERQRLLAKYYTDGVYVDVGCMDNPLPALLAETHKDIWALDFAEEIIEFLAPRFPKVHYKTILNEFMLPFNDETVNYVVAGEFIEHLEDPRIFIREAYRILKKGGWLAISTPFEEGVSQGNIGGAQHVWSFDRNDISDFLDKPETFLLKENSGVSILAWKQK